MADVRDGLEPGELDPGELDPGELEPGDPDAGTPGLRECLGAAIYDALTPSEQGTARRLWAAQERFLAGHAVGGTVAAGCDAAGISRRTVVRWRADDKYGFLERMDGAHEAFADRLERIGLELIQELRPGQNTLLLLAFLNAHRSRLFRPQATPDATVARDTLAELRRLRQHVDRPSVDSDGAGDGVDSETGAQLLRSALDGRGPSGAGGHRGQDLGPSESRS